MEKAKNYIPRLFDKTMESVLRRKGAIIVTGPKWCGKTTTSEQFCKSKRDLLPIETRSNLIALARTAPKRFFQGEKPLLIDEWQHVSFLWDNIKHEADHSAAFGLFILAGSVTDKSVMDRFEKEEAASRHTGTGRIVAKKMRTMSLFESGEGEGTISLSGLRDGSFEPGLSDVAIDDYAFLLCRGGWPLSLSTDEGDALLSAKDYVDMVAEEDLFSMKDIPIEKNPQKARRFLRSYARNISTQASNETIRGDVASTDGSFDDETMRKYLQASQSLYVVEELEAWNPYLRSRIAIRTKPTRHFVDPSIAAAALGVGPSGLFEDMTTFGLLFESMAVRDLRIYAEATDGRVYKYRDSRGREVDAVVEWPSGSFGLIEVKLGGEEAIEQAAQKLIALKNDIDEKRNGRLAFLMVVTKGPAAYQREDGVYVVPLSCLRD